MDTKQETTLILLEGLTKSAKALKGVSLMELLMMLDVIPVDVPVTTHAIEYIAALHSDTNEDVGKRMQKKINEIILAKQQINADKRKEEGTTNGGS